VQVRSGTGSLVMGMVVDEVSEVIAVAACDVEDTPEFGVRVATDYILGMARARGKMKILLDIDAVLTSQEIHGLEAAIQ
jgi:purine-binding chemotaxis protein CheW